MTAATPPSPHPLDALKGFGLIIVGDEILSGKRADKHLSKVIELLSARGLALEMAEYVGDDPQRITDSLRRAFHSGMVVFSCGGIGATPAAPFSGAANYYWRSHYWFVVVPKCGQHG